MNGYLVTKKIISSTEGRNCRYRIIEADIVLYPKKDVGTKYFLELHQNPNQAEERRYLIPIEYNSGRIALALLTGLKKEFNDCVSAGPLYAFSRNTKGVWALHGYSRKGENPIEIGLIAAQV